MSCPFHKHWCLVSSSTRSPRLITPPGAAPDRHDDVAGDTYIPEFDDVNEWRLTDREDFEGDAKNDYPYSFLIYDRAGPEEHVIPEEG